MVVVVVIGVVVGSKQSKFKWGREGGPFVGFETYFIGSDKSLYDL